MIPPSLASCAGAPASVRAMNAPVPRLLGSRARRRGARGLRQVRAVARGSASGAPIAQVSTQGAGGLATKNTTRLGGADPATDAAAVARAVYPGLTSGTRPQAVVLVDERDWPAALAASALASAPLGAPLLYSDGYTLPAASSQALAAMHPTGAAQAGGAQVIRIGTTAAAAGRLSHAHARGGRTRRAGRRSGAAARAAPTASLPAR